MNGWRSFRSTSTAPYWGDGVVVGSGRVGALVFGDPALHRVAIAHERFLVPLNPRPLPPWSADVMADVRRLLDVDREAAAALVDTVVARSDTDGLVWTDPLGLCAVLTWLPEDAGSPADYLRVVDLAAGTVDIGWRVGAARYGMHVAAPRGDERVLVRLDGPPGARGRLGLTVDAEDRAAQEHAAGAGYAEAVRVSTRRTVDGCAVDVVAAGPAGRATATTTLHAAADAWSADGRTAEVVLDANGRAEVVLDVAVSGIGIPEPDRAPVGDHRELIEAAWLRIGEPGAERTPVERTRAAARAGDRAAERTLLDAAFAAGRYTTIASTGQLPAMLQGVWQATFRPAWSADYTMNGNLQNGGAAALVPTGTPQLVRSLLRLVLPHHDDFRTNARRIWGLPGAVLPARMTTHGLSNHLLHDYPHQLWTGNGGWLLRIVADAVLATGDRSLVDDQVWALVLDVVEFAGAFLATGATPSYSPENAPEDAGTPVSGTTPMDSGVVRDTVAAALVLAEARGDTGRAAAWQAIADAAPDYRITSDGMLAEWLDPRDADRLAHRHASQLYPLWYDVDPAFADPALASAAAELVRRKIAWRAADPTPPPGRMEMAFGLVQLGLAAANLGLAAEAEQCAVWLARDHFTDALVSTHDAGRIFNLDASGGLPALVAAMLRGSSRDELRPLQALPDGWRRGAVGGLTTRCGLLVRELSWREDGMRLEVEAVPGADWVRAGRAVVITPPRAATLRSGPAHPSGDRFVLDAPGVLDLAWSAIGD